MGPIFLPFCLFLSCLFLWISLNIYVVPIQLEHLCFRNFIFVLSLVHTFVFGLNSVWRGIGNNYLILFILQPKFVVLNILQNFPSVIVAEIDPRNVNRNDGFLQRIENLLHFFDHLVPISVDFVNFVLAELHHVLNAYKANLSTDEHTYEITESFFLNENILEVTLFMKYHSDTSEANAQAKCQSHGDDIRSLRNEIEKYLEYYYSHNLLN